MIIALERVETSDIENGVVHIPAFITTIKNNALNIRQHIIVDFHNANIEFEHNALGGNYGLIFMGADGSTAHEFSKDNGIEFVIKEP